MMEAEMDEWSGPGKSASDLRLERAKKEAAKGSIDGKRRWLVTDMQCYGGDSYLTRLHVLEGTPPRAYVLENAGREVCHIIDMDGLSVGRVVGGNYVPVRFIPARRVGSKPTPT